MNPDMETNIIVLNQDHCVHPEVRHVDKGSGYVYAGSVGPVHDGSLYHMTGPFSVLDSEMHPPHSRVHQHINPMQPVQYSQLGFDGVVYPGLPSFIPPVSGLVSTSPLSSGYLSTSVMTEPAHPPAIPKDSSFPQDDFQYFREIQHFLNTGQIPPNKSELYRARLNKKAKNYVVIQGVLYHNVKHPKKVIMRKIDQEKMLKRTHVAEDSGVHLGVKKIFSLLQKEVFWRGMYLDIVKFVKQCSKCSDAVNSIKLPKRSSDSSSVKEESNCKSVQTSSSAWQHLEVEVHGGYVATTGGSDCVVTLTCPVSRYVAGWAGPRTALPLSAIVSTVALLGPPASLYVIAPPHVDPSPLVAHLQALLSAHPLLMTVPVSPAPGPSLCPWLPQLINLLVSAKPDRWDLELENYLLEWRLGGGTITSPFSIMFPGRTFYQGSSASDDKENIDCTSSKGTDDEADSGNEEGVPQGRKNNTEEPTFKPSDKEVQGTINELKAYLKDTKEARCKRGKYHKYNPEVQELMIDLAMKKGPRKASQYFSKTLKTHVSESTIRNLTKSHLNLHPSLKEEIGLYASNHGLEKACRHYSTRLQQNLPINLVRKLHTIYVNKMNRKKNQVKSGPSIDTLSEKVKWEIGLYGCQHSLTETVEHFMAKGIELGEELADKLTKYVRSKQGEPGCSVDCREKDEFPIPEEIEQRVNIEMENDDEQPKRKKDPGKKRGQYSTYSPELRAEIGKYAAEHGSLNASTHFSQLLGREMPESTARGLRAKYLKKGKGGEVSSLGWSARGRPLRLGRYDSMVQDCLRELVRSGERVTSFLALTTARSVLNKYEPNLLKENGGSVELNPTWAKSFLKRIGVRNNS